MCPQSNSGVSTELSHLSSLWSAGPSIVLPLSKVTRSRRRHHTVGQSEHTTAYHPIHHCSPSLDELACGDFPHSPAFPSHGSQLLWPVSRRRRRWRRPRPGGSRLLDGPTRRGRAGQVSDRLAPATCCACLRMWLPRAAAVAVSPVHCARLSNPSRVYSQAGGCGQPTWGCKRRGGSRVRAIRSGLSNRSIGHGRLTEAAPTHGGWVWGVVWTLVLQRRVG